VAEGFVKAKMKQIQNGPDHRAAENIDPIVEFQSTWNAPIAGIIGFTPAGSLVYCDGNQVTNITVKESVLRIQDMLKREDTDEYWGSEARVKWLGMVAAAIR
jgi:hypothetical protein